MDFKATMESIEDFLASSDCNVVSEDDALGEGLAGMRVFRNPIYAVGDAADPLFKEVLGECSLPGHVALPGNWVDGARSVVSIFFPFTDELCESNDNDEVPAPG